MADGSADEPPVPPGVDPEVPSPARPPGSYPALSHVTADNVPPQAVRTGLAEYAKATENIHLRPRAEVERFFAGLDLVPPWPDGEPRLVHVGEWGAEDPEVADSDGSHWGYAGVGRVPGL